MRIQAAVWICVVSSLFASRTRGGDDKVPPRPLVERVKPVGGWAPYGGGLLRWWPHHCFPACGAPDDYCRKTLPPVCRPPYPCYYTWGPPEVCCPQGTGSSCASAR